MQQIPIFPLNLVAFPGEKVNLHIFEPRYRQMIRRCLAQDSSFAIVPYINDSLQVLATEMRVTALEKEFEDGRMAIRTVGVQRLKIKELIKPTEDTLFMQAMVKPLEEYPNASPLIEESVLLSIAKLYEILKVDYRPTVNPLLALSFQVGHKIGLSIEQEYDLLTADYEAERQSYILNHLNKVIPVLAEVERTKELIKLNGHFKTIEPPELNLD